jgi:hypothetical protein
VKRLVLPVFLLIALLVTTGFAQNLTVGFTVSNTGNLNVDSVEQLHGFELWRDQVNEGGRQEL